MEKHFHTLFVFTALFFSSCKPDKGYLVTSAVKVIVKCCNEMAVKIRADCKLQFPGEEIGTFNRNENAAVLPLQFWDKKMMIW